MKSDTTDILNEADNMERRLSWVLFKQEQNARLFNGEEYDWRGNLLWRPGDVVGLSTWVEPEEESPPSTDELIAYGHTHVFFNPPRCDECETYWKGPEPCFICGEVRDLGFEFYPGHGASAVRVRFGVDAEGFGQSMARAMEAFVGDFSHSFIESGRAVTRAFNQALTPNETRRMLGLPEVQTPAIHSNHDSPAAVDFVRYTEADADAACEIYRQSSIIENWDQIFPPDVAITIYPNENGSNSIQMPENVDLEAPVAVPTPVVDLFSSAIVSEMSRLIERRHAEDRRNRAIDMPVTERRRPYGSVT